MSIDLSRLGPDAQRQIRERVGNVPSLRPRLTPQDRLLRTVTEDQLKANVLEMAARFGWLRFHARPGRTKHGWATAVEGDGKGFPDMVLVREKSGRPFGLIFAELKTEVGKLSEDQERWSATLRAFAGMAAYVQGCVTPEDARDGGAQVVVWAGTWRPRDWHGGEIERWLR